MTYQGVCLAASRLAIGEYDGIVAVHRSAHMFARNRCIDRFILGASQYIVEMKILSRLPTLGVELEILVCGFPDRGYVRRPYPLKQNLEG